VSRNLWEHQLSFAKTGKKIANDRKVISEPIDDRKFQE